MSNLNQFLRSTSTPTSTVKELPSLPTPSGPVDIKKMSLRELQEALQRERKLLQTRSALLAKLPDKGARIQQKIHQMEEEERSRLEKKTNEEQLRRRSDVLQRVEFAVQSLSCDSARRLAEVVRSSLDDQTLHESFQLEDIDDVDEDEETKQKRRMEEEEEEEGVAAVLRMLATSQISQNGAKQVFLQQPQAEVPLFARKCAELATLHPPGNDRFVPNRPTKVSAKTPPPPTPKVIHPENGKAKTGEWDESLKTPPWAFKEAKTLPMEEAFDLIAHLSNTAKGLAEKKKEVSFADGGRIVSNAYRSINDAALTGAAYHFEKDDDDDGEDSDEEIEDNETISALPEDEDGGETLADLINSTLNLT